MKISKKKLRPQLPQRIYIYMCVCGFLYANVCTMMIEKCIVNHTFRSKRYRWMNANAKIA